MQRSAKERQSKPVFCIEGVVTITVTENSPPMKMFHEKDLTAIQECSHNV